MVKPIDGAVRRVNISDVAELAGYSKGSVSKAMNNQPGISDKARAHILRVAEAAGWRPSARAVALSSQGTRTIAFLLNRSPDLLASDPFFAELLSGIESVLAKHGYWLLLRIGHYDTPEDEAQAYRELVQSERIDGVLVAETRVDDFRLALVRELGIPAVIISKPWAEVDVPWEGPTSPGGGMDEAVGHVVEGGHTRVAYVSGPADRSYVMFRTQTLLEAIADQGASLVGIKPTNASAEQGFAATEELLNQRQRPTAILYDNDQMALAGCRAIRSRGLRIPEDVAVVGHDDLYVSKWFTPALTTVSQDIEGLGARCANRLLGILGEDVEEYGPFGDPKLIVRESTSPVAG
ncbi:LacI family transcriptional regulator [Mycetocola tolaasinivorans]|uniref:LacI family transcriptional regulator n=1 Tax=Mycetocola tolaasinivorans TaxID=76635 RepID=A0A3L7A5G2_9MICO|nr:LacI family DNA-binding transcriptional regulator [Mycetocola tolaasinivorans]RLP74562.1 LacI family transcriptional regulator [Mycetocola tolaasinivorans]